MTESSNWGFTGFSMDLSVMTATKLADSCFLYCFCRVLCCRVGGSCGGGPLYTLGSVKGSGGIVWTAVGEITLGCVRAVYCWGVIIDTFGSGIVTFGVGDVGMRRTGDAVWKSSESLCKTYIWAYPNVVNRASGDGFRNALTILSDT